MMGIGGAGGYWFLISCRLTSDIFRGFGILIGGGGSSTLLKQHDFSWTLTFPPETNNFRPHIVPPRG